MLALLGGGGVFAYLKLVRISLRPRAMTVWTIMIMERKIPRNGKPRMRSRKNRMLTGAAQKKMMRTV